MSDCLFCSIAAGDIESKKLYEDDTSFAFEDIDPKAPAHALIIPKEHISSLAVVDESKSDILGHLLVVANELSKQLGVNESGYRVVINAGADAGQEVAHIHVHLLGGRKLSWPPG